MTLRNHLLVLTGAAALLLSSAASAQQDPTYGADQAQPQQATFTDSQLKQFVEAQTEVAEIQQNFSQRLEGVEDPAKASELQNEANGKMVEAVEKAGLDVSSFNQIAMAVQNDPRLQEKVQAISEGEG